MCFWPSHQTDVSLEPRRQAIGKGNGMIVDYDAELDHIHYLFDLLD